MGGVLYAHFLVAETLAGHLGVRLFFVLSGFLITRILIDVREDRGFQIRTALTSFYIRRLLRIVPAYFLLLFTAFALGAVEETGTIKWFVTYLANFLYAIRDAWNPWVLGHTWTLSIEEQFYALWPLIVFLAPRGRLQLLCWIVIAISLAFRFYFPVTFEPSLARDLLPPASMDALGAGSLLAVWRADGKTPSGSHLAIWAALCLSVALPVLFFEPVSALGEWLAWVALELLFLPVFIFAVNGAVEGFGGPAGRVLANRHVRFLGRISYGIYLYHFLVLWAVMTYLPDIPTIAQNGPVRFLLCGSLTIIVAILSWFLLEHPINTLKRHFPYRSAAIRREPVNSP